MRNNILSHADTEMKNDLTRGDIFFALGQLQRSLSFSVFLENSLFKVKLEACLSVTHSMHSEDPPDLSPCDHGAWILMKSMLPSLPLLHVLAGMLQSMTTDQQCVGCFLAAFFCLVGCWKISSGCCTTKNVISPTTLHLFQGIIVEDTKPQ